MNKYELPELPYKYNALEPVISEAILRVHHDKLQRIDIIAIVDHISELMFVGAKSITGTSIAVCLAIVCYDAL